MNEIRDKVLFTRWVRIARRGEPAPRVETFRTEKEAQDVFTHDRVFKVLAAAWRE